MFLFWCDELQKNTGTIIAYNSIIIPANKRYKSGGISVSM